ncbi:MAG: hypothetical protein ABGX16_21275 [Pirellulales bacterium]
MSRERVKGKARQADGIKVKGRNPGLDESGVRNRSQTSPGD